MAENEKVKTKEKGDNLPRRGPKEGEVGVAYLAEQLGIAPASVRVKLRKANIDTNDQGVYSWSKTKADQIVKQLKTAEKDEKKKKAA
jgi:hypothetical protein